MNVNELVEKHAEETAKGGGILNQPGEYRAEEYNALIIEWLKRQNKQFAIELLESLEPSRDDTVAADYCSVTALRNNYWKALEELKR